MENEDLLLKDIIENKSETSLINLFNLRTSEWKYWLMLGDYSTRDPFNDLTKLSTNDAFHLISTAIEICLIQDDPDLFDTALSLISILARTSDTTELPSSLKEKWGQIKLKAEEIKGKDSKTLMGYIQDWYREIK